MSTEIGSTSEDLSRELLDSLRPFATDSEIAALEAELARQEQAKVETIAKTRAEAARLVGVDERTISKWQADPEFPGRPGDAGQANGHYPIERIKAWREATRRTVGSSDDALSRLKRRKLAADTRTREVKLARETGELIALADAQAVIVDAINAARSQLEAWPSKVAEHVSASRPKLRRWLLRMATKQVREVLRGLEDAASGGGEDDSEPSDPGGSNLLQGATRLRDQAAKRDP